MEALLERLFGQIADLPVWGQFLATVLATALGEEIAAISIWGLARNGTLPWAIAASGMFVGAWTTHALPWAIGRSVGARALSWRIFADLRGSVAFAKTTRSLQRQGWIVLGLTRFLPGIRVAVYLLAGVLSIHPGVFLPVLTGVTLLWMAGTFGVLQVAATLLETHPIPTLGGAILVLGGGAWIRARRGRRSDAGVDRGTDVEAAP